MSITNNLPLGIRGIHPEFVLIALDLNRNLLICPRLERIQSLPTYLSASQGFRNPRPTLVAVRHVCSLVAMNMQFSLGIRN